MGEAGFVVVLLYPRWNVTEVGGEGMHVVEGSEVMEVGQQATWGKVVIGPDVNASGVLEEAELA